jgi:hypothetical protein
MIIKLLKVLGIVIAVVAILLVTAALLLNTDRAQNWLLQRAVAVLKDRLHTEVSAGHVSVSLFKGSVTLSQVEVDDQQGRKMLRMKELAVGFSPRALWHRQVVVTRAHVSGLKALLCRPASPSDSTANYQFLVEALKSRKKASAPTDSLTPAPPHPVTFRLETATIDIDSLVYQTDNGRPRKNTGKPHRGAFDAGHLDLCAAMTVRLDSSARHITITDCRAIDRGSGLQVDSLQLQAAISKDSIRLSDVTIRLPHTRLSFDQATVALPDTSAGRPLSYQVPRLTATVLLRDIAKPFAPVLKRFTTPLQLQSSVSGDADKMHFGNVRVQTADRRLLIQAAGNIAHLRQHHEFHVHFDVSRMTALPGMPEHIIDQFSVKKFMMKQLRALGRIDYRGHFDVVYRKESFAGQLNTQHGSLRFQFAIDENNKYLNGSAETDSLQLGRIMDMKDLHNIACHADFRFDISKPRTAVMRRQKGGKLPIGSVEAEVGEVHYKFITLRNVSATIVSDGALATGNVNDRGKRIDIGCDFSFTNTDQMQKLKVKPRVQLHRKRSTGAENKGK